MDNTAVNVSVFLTPYLVNDGETPEMISYKVYENSQYHWVILHINNIINPRTEWPLENRFIIPLIYDTYDFILYVDDVSVYDVGDEMYTTDGGNLFVTGVEDDYITARSRNGQTFITTQSQISIQKDATTRVRNLRVTSVLDPEEQVHHYENVVSGFIVDNDITNADIVAITNYDYEVRKNDEKRLIKLLAPDYLRQFVINFDNLING